MNQFDSLIDYPELNMPPRILMGPGPSMVHPKVLAAMSIPLVGHLDPCFLEIMNRTQSLLRYTFETNNPLTIPISGTGSAAMEASVASLIEPGDKVLVCINGYFGGRIAEMARRHGGDVQTIECSWGDIFSLDKIKKVLRIRPAKLVAIVHAETSTGAMQPLEGLADIIHDQGGIFLVDAVTSLGGISVSADKNEIDICYSATQKCLGCPPGLGPVTVGPRVENILQKRKSPVSAWYLDLTLVNQYWGPERSYHHTAPISSNFALYEGLRLIVEEGLERRWQRHRQNAELLWEGLEALNLKLHVPKAYRLPMLTTVRVPEGVDESNVRRHLLDEYNIEIAGGLGELKGKVWRIGLMGFSSRQENVLLLLSALEKLLQS